MFKQEVDNRWEEGRCMVAVPTDMQSRISLFTLLWVFSDVNWQIIMFFYK